MKTSSAWISSDAVYWDNQQPLDVDQNGWVRSLAPSQIASSLMLRGFSNYPAGQYLVRYKGEGTLAFSFFSRHCCTTARGDDHPSHRRPTPVFLMQITATNPANYLREIEIIMPGGTCVGDPFTHADSRNCAEGVPSHHIPPLLEPSSIPFS
jgi:hypothetical protein